MRFLQMSSSFLHFNDFLSEFFIKLLLDLNTPSILKDMIFKCWRTDPEKRDSFTILRLHKDWDQVKEKLIKDGEKNYSEIRNRLSPPTPLTFPLFINNLSDILKEPVKLYYNDPTCTTPEIRLL